jgi:VanZ family protein
MSNKLSIQLLTSAVAPPIVWATVIFFLSSQPTLPGLDLVISDFLLKKTAHIIAYAVLYLLVWRSIYLLTLRRSTISKTVWVGAFAICMLYALTDEWHQSLTPTRTASLRDVGFDAAGMLTAFLWKYKYI